MTASLVFEQEYNGVEGDSASCAELFALLSSLAQVPIKQGIAVTGALNQHGEVLPVGGLNEKIEGYFRVCKDIGLDGKQGVLLPDRNQRHLILSDEVLEAVANGQFHIATMNNVAEGILHLTGCSLAEINRLAEARLGTFKLTLEDNSPKVFHI
jgi:predicted ATP-dependent protease